MHHNLVYQKWEIEVIDSDVIGSAQKREIIKNCVHWPRKLGLDDYLMANWGTKEMLEKSKTNSENRLSNPDDKGIISIVPVP